MWPAIGARRAKGVSLETTIAELAPHMRGWRSYFGLCERPEALVYLTRWSDCDCGWPCGGSGNTTPSPGRAADTGGPFAGSQSDGRAAVSGPWYLARAKPLSVGLSNAYLDSLGLPRLIDGG